MLLRVSSEMQGEEADLSAIIDSAAAQKSGVAHGASLIAFADAVVDGDDESLERARAALLAAVGPEALVDAAGVVGNFQRMVRIADSTGIPLDGPVNLFTADLREDLALNAFGSAENTPQPSAPLRALARCLAPLAGYAFRIVGRLYRG